MNSRRSVALLFALSLIPVGLPKAAQPDVVYGPVSILAESVFGADGLLFHDGFLWVASNQSDAMVALDERGRVRARVRPFLGIGADGAPKGLLFPSGGAVQGKRMIVANLSFPLTANSGDEWEEEVTRWNLMSFEIPQLDTQ